MGTSNRIPLWILLVTLVPLHAQIQYGDYAVEETETETYDYNVDETVQQQQQVIQQQQQVQQQQQQQKGAPRISVIQVDTNLPVKALNVAHNNRVCSTWGNFHFKNFDGDIFHFPGTCNYVFASHCKSTYEDFNIQMRRSVVDNVPVIEKISMKLDGLIVQLDRNAVLINGNRVLLPFSGSGIQVEKHGVYLTVTSKLGLVFMWNDDDSLLLELDSKFANTTCGLCGDFNGISIHNEFISNGIQMTAAQFGNLQKLDGPTEQCQDVPPTPKSNCTDYEKICESALLSTSFSSCHPLVAIEQYIEVCVQDLCHCEGKDTTLCLCNTFAEYSRQCAHAGGNPKDWRTKDLCPKTCPYNMVYQECGSPCPDTCSNPERALLCENHCMEGCFCPPGTVFDDIHYSGCVPLETCSCTFNSNAYAAGTSYSTSCSACMCSGGKWSCQNLPCPASCSIEGGSHITTYDQTHYSIHGDCNYVLSKACDGDSFIVLAEMRKCGLTESETCLKSTTIILNGGETIIVIKPCGSVFVNSIYTQLPVSAANVTIFRPSSFYIIVHTNLGVQILAQLTPFMQVYVALDPAHKGLTCGLCGNFNDKQSDDFQTISGVIEGTAASFANTWKTQGTCSNVKNVYEDPCSLSVENEKYAQHWCGLISDATGPFAACHATINPAVYKENCMFDTCNCEKSEECMCASLSSYVRACATKGIILTGWRDNVCTKYMHNCPKSLNYTYSTSTCQPTCRSLSEPDVTCSIKFAPVDGCTCSKEFYMDDSGKCVPAAACPCYYKGSAVPSGEVVHDNSIMCTCVQGKLSCIGSVEPACKSPMVYFDCNNATVGTKGSECQKSCQTLDMACYSAKCVSGCVCPDDLVADGKGGCIKEDDCPCIHNDATYQPGEQIKMKCNTCTCKNRMWQCTKNPCLATCAVYGDGHYITFDGKRYSFSGDCEYILAQDHCGQAGNSSTFRVITENIPCGTTGTTCSKSIKVFMENYELVLTEEHIEVVERGIGGVVPYKVRHMGIYLVIEADNGLILMWDRKTSIFIKLSKDFEGKVCGLCGNYDGDGNNDFTTRSQSVVGDVAEFGNSWKIAQSCPDANVPKDACSANPYRKSWSQKQCSIINSRVFSACHAQVDPSKYYDACVSDACACDSGGDCECFCTAVAAYAQACGEAEVCVSWRSPSICPLFCDYYNPEGECEWHYKPCGTPCLKTCRNPSGKCLHEFTGLEGCYPSCPAAKSFFDEDEMECVAQCGCYDDEEKHYRVGQTVPSRENCQTCTCSLSGVECKYQKEACQCEYQGKMYHYNDVIYNTTDGIGGCITAICKENGTIYRDNILCTTIPPTIFSFTTTHPTTTSGTTVTHSTTVCVKEECKWSQWFDASYPEYGMENGDFDTYENIKAKGYSICSHPQDIECRAERFPNTPLSELEQNVQCNVSYGLICKNKEQLPPICYNYEIRVKCCSFVPCDIKTTTSPIITTETPTTITTTPTTTHSATTSSATPEITSTPSTTIEQTTIASTTASTVPSTTVCQPKCTWTSWIDVHIPGVGKQEGDFETYENIQAAGQKICRKPDGIQCRSEKFPEVPIGKIGQVVQCNVTIGLVCHNEEQDGDFKVCLNYQIKVLCCDDYSHCEQQTTPSISPTTIETTPTPIIVTTTETTTVPTTTSTTTETTTTPIIITTTTETTTVPTTTETTTSTTTETTPAPIIVTTTETTTVPTTTSTTTETTTTPIIITTTTETTTVPTTTETTSTTPETSPTTIIITTATETTTVPTTTETTTSTTTKTTDVPVIIQTTSKPTPPTPAPQEKTTTIPICQPQCKWTTWIDISTPTPGIDGGDKETFKDIMAKGKNICKYPQNIECRATNYPSISMENVGQIVTCDITVGLVCNNKDQIGAVKQCYNYEIKVFCCDDYSHCSTTVPTTPEPTTESTTTSTVPTTTESTTTSIPTTTKVITTTPKPTTTETTTTSTVTTTTESTTTSIPTTTKVIITTPKPTTTETTTTSTVTTTTESTTTTIPTTTKVITTTPKPTTESTPTETTSPVCQPQCKWTQWIDVDTPGSGIDGGDKETYENIMAKGKQICNHPQNIECRAEEFPGINIENVGQIVKCDVTVGLVCNNKDQIGKVKECYNYQIKVFCCDDYSHCSTTPVPTTTTSAPTTTKVISTTPKPTTTAPTTTTTITTTTESTTTPILTTETTPTTTVTTTTEQTTTPKPTTTETKPTTTVTTTTEPTTTPKATTTETKPTTTITTTTEPTTTPKPTTTTSPDCQPQCKWTQWIDVDTPGSDLDGGDKETYENIMAKGKQICKHPQDIECRAEEFPGISIENVGQIVKCDVNVGLVCNNKDQIGKVKECYNYQIKVLCCDDYSHCSTTPVPTTTTSAPTTTHIITTTPKPTTTAPTTTTTITTTTESTTTPILTTTETTPVTTITTTTEPTTTPKLTTETKPTTTVTTTTEPTTTPKPTTTTSPDCQPQCKWTHWIDVDTPVSGLDGGDKETYENIMAKGKQICKHPQDIECRAEEFPGISIENVGQIVKCDVTVGLVCNNKDQIGIVKECYNYQIKVLCCDDYSHCSTTPVPTTTTSAPTTTKVITTTPKPTTTAPTTTTIITTTTESTTTPILTTTETTPTTTETKTTESSTTSIPTTKESSTSTIGTTTKRTTTATPKTTTKRCFCRVDNKYFSPGQIIYNKTDEAGCSFYAVCNDLCEPERFTGPCTTTTQTTLTTTTPKTTTSPTTPKRTTTPTTTITTVVKTTPVEGCPPKKTNETWINDKCEQVTCHGNNVTTHKPVTCPEVKPLTCANGFPPIKKKSADGCCDYLECQCVCSGWGDPHYITFDGVYYTFLDNCTYVLVQQITPKYDNFRILVDNYFCDAEDGLSCPQSILIYYKSNEIVLTRMLYQGRMKNRIRFNNDWITPGFTQDGITVTSAGINMNVEIPEIDAFISFSGMIFVIKLPFSKFAYNTEGQCGTCSNNSTEDCRMPSGKIVKDCSTMAPHWRVNTTAPGCNKQPPPTPPPLNPTPAPTCKPSHLCDVILSDVFAECHKIIPPKPYHEGCVFDACRISNDSVQCSSLEVYASLCIANGVCIDWRGKTGGHCPYNCPSGKVYNPCGPVYVNTCENKHMESPSTGKTEGCFCPADTTLFNSFTDTCVKSCACVGPDGMPKAPAETWTSGCKKCVCEANSLTVQCEPLTCPKLTPITCEKEGFISVTLPNPEQPCCMLNECQCNSSYCLHKENRCDIGFEQTPVFLEGDCCPKYECSVLPVCVYHEEMYKPGHLIPQAPDSCHECVCSYDVDVMTLLHIVNCTPISCDKECEKGFQYMDKEGHCCGHCVQFECIMKMKNDEIMTIPPGETWTTSSDNCTYHQCIQNGDHFDIHITSKECAVPSEKDCPLGYSYEKAEGECCGKCVQVACVMKLRDNTTQIVQPGETWSPSNEPCIKYKCEITEGQYVPTEIPTSCSIEECPLGTKYEKAEGECCGKCVQVACIMKLKDNTTKILQPGEKWSPPDQPCVKYECEIIEGQFNPTEVRRACPIDDCSPGTKYEKTEGECCGNCVQVACVMKMKDNTIHILQPGETWSPPDQPCVKYECEIIEGQFNPTEIRRVCPIEDCPLGYTYETTPGECCGKCEKVACVMKLLDNSTQILKSGEVYVPPEDKCSSYECTSSLELKEVTKTCPAFNLKDCLEGTIRNTEDGCCKICDSAISGCQVHKHSREIKSGTCESDQVVEFSYCGGGCMTSSMYSADSNTMEHKCSCCQEVKTSKRNVNLKCQDGTSTVYTYLYAEECGCATTECDKNSISQQVQQKVNQEQQKQTVN
ncbi:mucin-5B-like [Mantella aurantiaca]